LFAVNIFIAQNRLDVNEKAAFSVPMLIGLRRMEIFSQIFVNCAQNKKEYYDYYYILHNFAK